MKIRRCKSCAVGGSAFQRTFDMCVMTKRLLYEICRGEPKSFVDELCHQWEASFLDNLKDCPQTRKVVLRTGESSFLLHMLLCCDCTV